MNNKTFQELKNRSIFAKLKRLFSGDEIIRNIGGKNLKVADIHQIEYAADRTSLRDRFNRLRSSATDNYSRDFNLAFQRSRVELFRDYDTMDLDPILHSALDIYADECCTKNELGDILKIYSSSEEIKTSLENLFYDILNIEYNLWSWVRSLVKYGDFYLRLYTSPVYGIYRVEPYSAYNVQRLENTNLSNKHYVKFQVTIPEGNRMEELEAYQVAHFRIISDSNFLPNGVSILEGARRVWKMLCMLEDSVLIHRIMRAPEKRVFKIDVGGIPPNEVENHMNRIMDRMKKTPYVDPATGEYNLRFNMQNITEDFFMPVRGNDSGTSIETLSGLNWSGMEDVEYFRDKLMSALKIPKAFLGYEKELSGKATLSAEDVRFGRTVQRIQRFVLSPLNYIAIIHLYVLGFRDEQLLDFDLALTNPSTVFEREKLDIFKIKTEVAREMQEQKIFSRHWIYKNIYDMSDAEIDEISNESVEDSKQNYRFKQIENAGIDPLKKFMKTQQSMTDPQGNDMSGISSNLDGIGGLPNITDGGLNLDIGNALNTNTQLPTSSLSELEDKSTIDHDWESPYMNPKPKKKSQIGRKKAYKYPRGEDIFGSLENNRKVSLSESTVNKLTLQQFIDSE